MLDENGILWKMVRLRYDIEPTIVVPRKLTCFIIVEFPSGKSNQGISHTVNMVRCYFWWVGMHRYTPTHLQLPVMYSIPTYLVIHTTYTLRNPKGSFHWICHGLHWPTTSYIRRQQACTNVYLFANFVSNNSTIKKQNGR